MKRVSLIYAVIHSVSHSLLLPSPTASFLTFHPSGHSLLLMLHSLGSSPRTVHIKLTLPTLPQVPHVRLTLPSLFLVPLCSSSRVPQLRLIPPSLFLSFSHTSLPVSRFIFASHVPPLSVPLIVLAVPHPVTNPHVLLTLPSLFHILPLHVHLTLPFIGVHFIFPSLFPNLHFSKCHSHEISYTETGFLRPDWISKTGLGL